MNKSNPKSPRFREFDSLNQLVREVEPLEEAVQDDEEPEFREQSREEAPDAGIRESVILERNFTHGRSQS